MLKICGAKTRRSGNPCQRYGMKNGRCHLHGGKCTGAKTAEGKLRQKMANWKHGLRSKEAIDENRRIRAVIKEQKEFLQNA